MHKALPKSFTIVFKLKAPKMTYLKSLLISFLLLISFAVGAQDQLSIVSKMRYGFYDGGLKLHEKEGKHFTRTLDGGIIIRLGFTSQNIGQCQGPPYKERVFVKFDSTGANIDWQRCYDAEDTVDVAYIFPQVNNEFIEVGNDIPGWVVRRTTQAGNVVWKKQLNFPIDIITAIPSLDGGYLIMGATMGTAGDIPVHYGGPFTMDMMIVKVDSLGNKLWAKVIGGSYDDLMERLIATPDGGCFAVGGTVSSDYDCIGNHGPALTTSDVWIVRLDGAGNKLWHKCIGGSDLDHAFDACLSSAGGLYITGYHTSSDGDVQNHLGPAGSPNYWILETDTSGTIVWQRSIDYEGTWGGLTTIAKDKKGKIWCAGRLKTPVSVLSDTSFGGTYDAIVVRLDSTGVITGRRVMGTPQDDEAILLAAMAEGVMLVGGNYRPPATNQTMPPDTSSFISVFFNRIAPWSTSISSLSQEGNPVLEVYPNPARNEVSVRADISGSLRVTSADGTLVTSLGLEGKRRTTLKTDQWARGIYLISFKTVRGQQLTKKLILQ